MQQITPLVRDGSLGDIQFVDLVFHNAYGPDKPWFYSRPLSGGGCMMDLGVHLVDLALWALWALDGSAIVHVSADLFARGAAIGDAEAVEDLALATLRLATGTVVRIACSWRLHAGQDAVIGAAFYGTSGGAAFRNEGGSFFDFTGERFEGTRRVTLSVPPDHWSGRAAAAWAQRLACTGGFDPGADSLVAVADVLDRIYASASRAAD